MRFTEAALSWLETLLEERFGHAFSLQCDADAILMRLQGYDEAIRFDRLQSIFHQSRSDFPVKHWDASQEGFKGAISSRLPAPSEDELPVPLVSFNERGATFGYDILGLTYWMLTRLEEIGRADLDEHGRFPASASHAFQNGYLDRPVVDEWLIILGQVIQKVWPTLTLRKHEFRINVSHDVDRPSLYAFQPWSVIVRMMAGHLLKRRDLKALFLAPWIKLTTRRKLHASDPFNTFDWLMDVSEANGLKSAFYFICGCTNAKYDADYDINHPAIRHLIRKISQRGHEVGIHPSYETFRDFEQLKREFDVLIKVAESEGVAQKAWGGRMHYLRWKQPQTLRAWSRAGLTYDSTLGYPDQPGFRSGTSHEYFAFDPIRGEALPVKVRPLVMMESSVIDERKQGHEVRHALQSRILELKMRCFLVEGNFSLLWHNSSLNFDLSRSVYKEALEDRGRPC
ncbi:polysaccharide deacetylase family protein [Marinobacter sp.]|uniref:polysaccharide deacetylase family protein n=1 Tax=Marinobacter sp. TaxID=50741 RepID=UPI0035C68466